ncbi:hypothetical protein II5_05986 [Bacillus cereus MSX-A1]|nr:hypothetical protein II5_05986 [Bacillus cereus MSX-A1]
MRYFKGKQFERDIIFVVVGYYCRFSLSYRGVSEIWKKKNKTTHPVWHLDETYIKVKGEYRYLYRAIDGDGHNLDIQLRRTRNYQAA